MVQTELDAFEIMYNEVLELPAKDFNVFIKYYELDPHEDKLVNALYIANSNLGFNYNSSDLTIQFDDGQKRYVSDKCLKTPFYEIKQQTGKGTYGVVFEVINRNTRNKFIFKIIRADKDHERKMIAFELFFHTQFQELGNAPKLEKIWYCKPEQLVVIVMDKWNGSLIQLVKQGVYRLPLNLLNKLILTLVHAHICDFGHFDVKPANILYRDSPSFQLTLSDFGLSTTLKRIKQDPKWIQTLLNYMYHPQLAGEHRHSIYQVYPDNEVYIYPEFLDMIGIMNIYIRFSGQQLYDTIVLFHSIKKCYLEMKYKTPLISKKELDTLFETLTIKLFKLYKSYIPIEQFNKLLNRIRVDSYKCGFLNIQHAQIFIEQSLKLLSTRPT